MESALAVRSEKELINTSKVLGEGAQAIAELAAGAVSMDTKDYIHSALRVVQKARGGQFLHGLKNEWDTLREKGKIKEDHQSSLQHLDCLSQLLEFVDKDIPDSVKMETIKKIFLVAAAEIESNRNSLLPQQYMRIARSLESGEIIVLQAFYALIGKQPTGFDKNDPAVWLGLVAASTGLGTADLVSTFEIKLMEKNLVTQRTYADKSGVALTHYGRLTNLGFAFCAYINAYEKLS